MQHINKTVPLGGFPNFEFNLEVYDNGFDVVQMSKQRQITDSRFMDYQKDQSLDPGFNGVSSFAEAQELLASGYDAGVKKLGLEKQPTLSGEGKRVQFRNDVVGFAPVVPLYLLGVPNCMVNTAVKTIKTKVLNVYYDVGAIATVNTSSIEKAGAKLLSAIMELELAGYRFNLFACKSQTSGNGRTDMLAVKVKDAGRPVDIKRLSFPLAHPAFFRCITWDWYSRVPGGKFISGYGHSLTYEFTDDQLEKAFERLFNQKCVVLGLKYILDRGDSYIKNKLTGGQYAEV